LILFLALPIFFFLKKNQAVMWKNVSQAEVAKFRQLQRHWWDPTGPLRTLHMLNPIRVAYINDMCQSHLGAPLSSGLRVLDVGCGGGVLAESLGRLGGVVEGIDACAESLQVAQDRLQMQQNAGLRVSYVHADVATKPQSDAFDVVVVSEVVEHVCDPDEFLAACYRVAKPNGLVIVTTMDKSICTLVSHVLVAEYMLGLLAPGTHDWAKFVPPADLARHAGRHGVDQVSLQHVWAAPSLMTSVAARSLHLNFCLSSSRKSGHYFWTGRKRSSVE
jgi:2-polyprenyl-6-hydroxyphenyl methylase/3-demethylubiquinone-9 3-methyltransferase